MELQDVARVDAPQGDCQCLEYPSGQYRQVDRELRRLLALVCSMHNFKLPSEVQDIPEPTTKKIFYCTGSQWVTLAVRSESASALDRDYVNV